MPQGTVAEKMTHEIRTSRLTGGMLAVTLTLRRGALTVRWGTSQKLVSEDRLPLVSTAWPTGLALDAAVGTPCGIVNHSPYLRNKATLSQVGRADLGRVSGQMVTLPVLEKIKKETEETSEWGFVFQPEATSPLWSQVGDLVTSGSRHM